MTYSLDLRERVISFIEKGGSKVSAVDRFNVSRRVIHYWLNLDELSPKKHGPRHRKINKDALKKHVEDNPDALLRERAAFFKVHESSISRALSRLNIRKKKSDGI